MQKYHVVIRPEIPSDAEGISHVHMEAFKTHPMSNQTEHLIIKKMRERHDLTVSLVATMDSTVVGRIAFSKLTVDGLSSNWHLLGPLAVSPVHQRHGIGSQLVIQGLEELQTLKPDGCLLYGDPNYYHRFGFSPSKRFHHDGIPSHMLLAVTYAQTDSHGAIRFNPAFYAPTSSTEMHLSHDCMAQSVASLVANHQRLSSRTKARYPSVHGQERY